MCVSHSVRALTPAETADADFRSQYDKSGEEMREIEIEKERERDGKGGVNEKFVLSHMYSLCTKC